MARRPEAVAFDVIGTLFSLEPLRERLVDAGLPAHALETWYAEAVRDACAMAASGNGTFQPFQKLLDANLDALFQRHGVLVGRLRKGHVLAGMEELPAYPDAQEALGLLAGAGLPIVALSNGSAEATEALLHGAGLRGEVSHVLSVDRVGLSKPRREVYLFAAERAGVAPDRLALVAAHAWDVHGAKVAGLTAGFVARGRSFPPTMTEPDVQGEELADVARELLRLSE